MKIGGITLKKVQILGGGCARCDEVEKNTKKAVAELGIEADIVHVTDFNEIIEFGVTNTPALVIDQQVVGSGRIFTVDEIKEFLS